eukprot:scaffold508_cov554-Prasinococcus_capsulatus_cf.AAC.4
MGISCWYFVCCSNAQSMAICPQGVEDAGKAALRVSGFELGGLAGSLLAGKISDYVVGRAPKTAGIVGMRVKVRGRLMVDIVPRRECRSKALKTCL